MDRYLCWIDVFDGGYLPKVIYAKLGNKKVRVIAEVELQFNFETRDYDRLEFIKVEDKDHKVLYWGTVRIIPTGDEPKFIGQSTVGEFNNLKLERIDEND